MRIKIRLMHLGGIYNLLIHFSVSICMRETLMAAVYPEVGSVTNTLVNVICTGTPLVICDGSGNVCMASSCQQAEICHQT